MVAVGHLVHKYDPPSYYLKQLDLHYRLQMTYLVDDLAAIDRSRLTVDIYNLRTRVPRTAYVRHAYLPRTIL